jgi:hypothetical protein
MTTPTKMLVGGLAIIGGAMVASVIASRFITVALYSPYMPQYDLIAVNGATIWKLLAQGGGETPPKSAGGMPFPLGIRVYWFQKKPSIAAHAYESITGKQFEVQDILGS